MAPAHRHTQSALRFIIEGHGAYTAVDGERTPMQPGDFVITPSWTWHDHGNETQEPMVWLDGLDIQIVKLLERELCRAGSGRRAGGQRPEGDSAARFGNNLMPVDWRPEVKTSPVFNYPYTRTREVLERLSRNGDPDPYHGHKLRYVNPASGDLRCRRSAPLSNCCRRASRPALPFDRRHRLCRGRGRGREPGRRSDLRLAAARHLRRAELAAVSHHAEDEAVLFSYSDRPVQEKLGLWREQRGNA